MMFTVGVFFVHLVPLTLGVVLLYKMIRRRIVSVFSPALWSTGLAAYPSAYVCAATILPLMDADSALLLIVQIAPPFYLWGGLLAAIAIFTMAADNFHFALGALLANLLGGTVWLLNVNTWGSLGKSIAHEWFFWFECNFIGGLTGCLMLALAASVYYQLRHIRQEGIASQFSSVALSLWSTAVPIALAAVSTLMSFDLDGCCFAVLICGPPFWLLGLVFAMVALFRLHAARKWSAVKAVATNLSGGLIWGILVNNISP